MSLFVDLKVRLRKNGAGHECEVSTEGISPSDWLPVSLPMGLGELLNSPVSLVLEESARINEKRLIFGRPRGPGYKVLDYAIQKVITSPSCGLRVILEPDTDDACRYTYDLPAEFWSFSADEASGNHSPDHPLPAIVRLVPRKKVFPLPDKDKDWKVVWLGGNQSDEMLLTTRDAFRRRGLKFGGAFPLKHRNDLPEALSESKPNIAWLVGEGEASTNSILLLGSDGNRQRIGVDDLCRDFKKCDSLQLLFIHACHVGKLPIRLAEKLIRETGIPMVVTWETQDRLQDGLVPKEELKSFAREFFNNFSDGKPAEMALALARNYLIRNNVRSWKVYKPVPLAFKASGAREIQIAGSEVRRGPRARKSAPTRPSIQPKQLPSPISAYDSQSLLLQAHQAESSGDSERAIRLYEELTRCDDGALKKIASIRLEIISFNQTSVPSDTEG